MGATRPAIGQAIKTKSAIQSNAKMGFLAMVDVNLDKAHYQRCELIRRARSIGIKRRRDRFMHSTDTDYRYSRG